MINNFDVYLDLVNTSVSDSALNVVFKWKSRVAKGQWNIGKNLHAITHESHIKPPWITSLLVILLTVCHTIVMVFGFENLVLDQLIIL